LEIILFIPFILLLAAIAVMPFLFKNWWEENYGKFSLALALLVAIYYLVVLQRQNELLTALEDYFSFISLLGSLYIVSGGIYLKITGKPTPLKNSTNPARGKHTCEFYRNNRRGCTSDKAVHQIQSIPA
jgi:hypothetical protein